MSNATPDDEVIFEFKGIDHAAIIVKDMKETVDFYHGVLNMPVLHTLEYFDDNKEVIGQHWFFGVGDPSNPHAHIAAFWWRDGYQTLPPGSNETTVRPPNPMARPVGSLLHLNLRVDPENIERYCRKLSSLGIPFRHAVRYYDESNPAVMRAVNSMDTYVAPEEGALMSSVYVKDPSGIEIEFNAWLPGWENWPNDAIPLSNGDV